MAKYINPLTDFGFKHLYGKEEHKQLLIIFLNRVLEGERHIVDIEYRNKELLSAHPEGRSIIYDIYCITDSGEHIIVEMQNQAQSNFQQRTLYYAARAIESQSKRGKDWKYDIKAVYIIAFLNFKISEFQERLRVDGIIADRETGKEINEYLRLIYIQLPCLTKDINNCKDNFERNIYLLKNLEHMDHIPNQLKEYLEEIEYLENIMQTQLLTCEETALYESSLKNYRDALVTLDQYEIGRMSGFTKGVKEGHEKGVKEGHEKGVKEGHEKGVKEGQSEEARRIARELKANGIDINIIQMTTKLPLDIISAL